MTLVMTVMGKCLAELTMQGRYVDLISYKVCTASKESMEDCFDQY